MNQNKMIIRLALVNLMLIIVSITLTSTSVIPQKQENNEEVSYLSEYDSRKVMGEDVNTQELPSTTGALPEETITSEKNGVNKLINSLPIATEQFELQYDSVNNKIVIALLFPYDLGLEKFNSWIEENNYKDIPSANFIIIKK